MTLTITVSGFLVLESVGDKVARAYQLLDSVLRLDVKK
jgi:hypothetical protein